jgi:DUF4097 and DUF4098 domain-containing protein YvlB
MTLLAPLTLALAATLALHAGETKVQKVFPKGHAVHFKVGSSDCKVVSSPDGQIHVDVVFTYDPSRYEPTFQAGDTLELGEKLHGLSLTGSARWTIALPDGLHLEFRTGSGDLAFDGPQADLKVSTGSGDIDLDHVKGVATLGSGSGDHRVRACDGLVLTDASGSGDHEIKGLKGKATLSSGSGDFRIEDLEGDLEVKVGSGDITIHGMHGNVGVSTGSGNIHAGQLTLAERGTFNTGSGDVNVDLPRGEGYTLALDTGSGDATLHLDHQAPRGTFEFSSRNGEITSVEPFDKEEKVRGAEGGSLQRKSFTRGTSRNRITVLTGSGTAALAH